VNFAAGWPGVEWLIVGLAVAALCLVFVLLPSGLKMVEKGKRTG